ncbi:MAG TPA: hypothetical protein VN915_06705 [Elusimicrobiota bacterium]|nr:hypothetical protein [Elusimicrobiota bacterium]
MKIMLAAAIAAALSGCAGVVREDQVPVRELKNGSAIVLTIVEDPVTRVRCFIAYPGMTCLQPEPAK